MKQGLGGFVEPGNTKGEVSLTIFVCFYLQTRLIQTSQTGGQRYSDTSPFSIPCLNIQVVYQLIQFLISSQKFLIKYLSSFSPLTLFLPSWLTNWRLADALQLKLNTLIKKIQCCPTESSCFTYLTSVACIINTLQS